MTDALDRYLDALDRRLVGPERWRRDVLDEVRDGVLEAARRSGDEQVPAAVGRAIEEFGPPSIIGPLLADELRLRLARRAGAAALLVTLATGAAWQLYRTLVGFPASTVPDGPTAPVFLVAVRVVTTAPVVAWVTALLLVLLSGARRTTRARRQLLGALVRTSAAATVTTLGAVGLALVTIGGTHRGAAAVAGVATAAALTTALVGLHRAGAHIRAHGLLTVQP